MGVLRANSTNTVTFTPEVDLDSLALEATAAGVALDLGTPVQGAEPIGLWTLDVQSTDMPAAFSTILATWVMTSGSQVTRSREWLDVLPYEPSGPWLVSIDAAMDYLRLTGTTERELVAELLEQANADVQSYIGRAIDAATHTEQVSVARNQRHLRVKNWPLASVTSVTDPNGTAWSLDSFDVSYPSGILQAYDVLPAGTWTVVYAGLGVDEAAVLRSCVLDCVADAYQNRNPGNSSVGDGTTTASMWPGIPPRVESRLTRYRGIL